MCSRTPPPPRVSNFFVVEGVSSSGIHRVLFALIRDVEWFTRKVRIPLFMMRDLVYRALLSLVHTSVVPRLASCNNILQETSRELLKAHFKLGLRFSRR
jgi:hypothetical protein